MTSRLTGEQVVALLDRLTPATRLLWIGGGWGVDALVGRETRPHADLDLAVDAGSLPAVLELLGADGFAPAQDQLPVRIEVAHPDGRRVDLHPVVPGPDGGAIQAGPAGGPFHYPPGCTTTGTIAGREVTCLTAEQQLAFRRGYPGRPVDHHDTTLLRRWTGGDPEPAGDGLVARVRGLWAEVAGAAFPEAGVAVVCAPGSRVGPPGWVGSVTVGGAGLVTVPAPELVGPVRAVVERDGTGALARSLPVAGTLGPAELAYADAAGFRPAPGPVEWLEPGHPDLRPLLDGVGRAAAEESGLAGSDSRLAVVRAGGVVVSAAGWDDWPAATAHVGVLTATGHRDRGLAGRVAGAVTAAALERGLLPQWRARVVASQRVARRLGYRTLGRQFSVRPG